jgi:hypothetical protein
MYACAKVAAIMDGAMKNEPSRAPERKRPPRRLIDPRTGKPFGGA